MSETENITEQQLRNLQYKHLQFKVFREYTEWKSSLRGGSLIQTKPLQAFFYDLLDEVLEGIVKYEGYEKKIAELTKKLSETLSSLNIRDKKIAEITTALSNITSTARQQNPQARFID